MKKTFRPLRRTQAEIDAQYRLNSAVIRGNKTPKELDQLRKELEEAKREKR